MPIRRLRIRPETGPSSWRAALAIAATLALLLALGLGSLCLGTPNLAPARLLDLTGDRLAAVLVGQVRLPRLAIAVVAGAGFAVAGLLLQECLRNPLATPELLGMGPGAALVIATLVVFSAPVPLGWYPPLALGGALLGGVLTLAVTRNARTPTGVLLGGAAVGAALNALVVAVTSMAEQLQVQALFKYLSGSLAGMTWAQAAPALAWAALLLPLSVATLPWLAALRMGEQTAASLGVPVTRARWLVLALAGTLVAACVSATGPVAWIGFLAPHIARWATPSASVAVWLPLAAVIGAVVTVAADLGARLWFAPVETPVGAWTAVLGVVVALFSIAAQRVSS